MKVPESFIVATFHDLQDSHTPGPRFGKFMLRAVKAIALIEIMHSQKFYISLFQIVTFSECETSSPSPSWNF
jgi:hypothetical protein